MARTGVGIVKSKERGVSHRLTAVRWHLHWLSSSLIRVSMGRGGVTRVVDSQEPRRLGDVEDDAEVGGDLNQLLRGEGDGETVVALDDVDAVLPKESHELGRELAAEDVGDETSEDEEEEERRHSEQTPGVILGLAVTLPLPFSDRLQTSSDDEGGARRDSKSSDCLRRLTWLRESFPGPLDLDLERALETAGL